MTIPPLSCLSQEDCLEATLDRTARSILCFVQLTSKRNKMSPLICDRTSLLLALFFHLFECVPPCLYSYHSHASREEGTEVPGTS